MIAKYLSIPINQVTSRMIELRNIKYVTFSHEGQCPYGSRNSNFWKCTKYGDMAGEIIDDPKVALVEPLPYIITYSTDHDRLTAQYKASSQKNHYTTCLKVWPSGKMDFECDCYDFVNTKACYKPCKHIKSLIQNGKKYGHITNLDYTKRSISGVEQDD